jgi:DNA-directed RNA polymerase subunit RPC12/RpoP
MNKKDITIGYVCLTCRKVYKKHKYKQDKKGNWSPIEYDVVCPQCSGPMYESGDAFKAPKHGDSKAWSKLAPLFKAGYKFNRDFGSPFAELIPVKKKQEKLPKSEFRKPARKRKHA